jgi:lipopolysaccharide/colanic/teichoic acid biosynthesis glycosyltransferase
MNFIEKRLSRSKRVFDVVFSAFALVIFSPIFMVASLLIRLDTHGPIFLKQTRVGYRGNTFTLYKFRSMVVNAEQLLDSVIDQNHHSTDSITFKIKNDRRITRIGKWLRKFSIDEFPQFWNVLRGDMSIVGPRPAVPREVAKYNSLQRKRLDVVPGLTCLWQVNGRADIDFNGQVELDIEYVNTQSFWNDMVIVAKTVPAVLLSRGSY